MTSNKTIKNNINSVFDHSKEAQTSPETTPVKPNWIEKNEKLLLGKH